MSKVEEKPRYRIGEILSMFPKAEYMHTKKALAAELGITTVQLNALIRGSGGDWTGAKLQAVARFFGVSIDELFEKDEAQPAFADRA